jgi:hypothetical protein
MAEFAVELISRVKHRRDKVWRPKPGERGDISYAVDFARVNVDEDSTLILTRNNYVADELVCPELRHRGIIFERHGRTSINERLYNAARSWQRLIAGGKVFTAEAVPIYDYVSRVARDSKTKMQASRGDEETSFEDLVANYGLINERQPWYEVFDRAKVEDREYIRAALARGDKPGERPRVVVSTVHGSKGAEADHVVVLKDMAKRTHREMEMEQDPDDEVRVWYVAVTRAKKRLTIVDSQTSQECPWI